MLNSFCQLLNEHGNDNVRQTEIHIAEPLKLQPSHFEVKAATPKLERYESQGTEQIPAEMVHAEGETLCSEIHKPINSIWNKDELPQQWNNSVVYLFTRRVIKLTLNLVIIVEYQCYQLL
jgi:hypothetical protein